MKKTLLGIKSILYTLLCAVLLLGCEERVFDERIKQYPDVNGADWVELEPGLRLNILEPGEGPLLQAGDQVRVEYFGWYEGGATYASSLDRRAAFSFPLGKGRVIQGWERALLNTKKGSLIQLIVPPNLGEEKPEKGRENTALVFNIQILAD